MSLDRYLDDFGRDLTRATAQRRRSRRRRRVLLLPGAAALGVAAATWLPGLGGESDTLAKARAALAPQGEMVHMVMRYDLPGSNRPAPRVEQWYVGEPMAWRTVMEFPRGKNEHGRQEVAVNGDRMHIHAPDRDVITIYRGFREPPMTPGFGGGDPVEQVRKMLADGKARDEGIVTVDGRKVRRLVGEAQGGSKALRPRTVYLMDPQTFAPISIHYEMPRKGKLSPLAGVNVETYERLPINAQTTPLLRIQDKTPNTKYVWRDVKHP